MADNVAITAGAGTTVATDDISGVHYQKLKIAAGKDGTYRADVDGRANIDGDANSGALFVDPRRKVVRLSQTPTISTSAYTAKDAVGGLLTFASAARASGGSIIVDSVQVVDLAAQKIAIDLVLFDSAPTTPTDNAVFDPPDGELDNVVGVISLVAGDYADFNDSAVATKHNIGLSAVLSASSLYGVLVTRGTPTYATTADIVVTVTVVQD